MAAKETQGQIVYQAPIVEASRQQKWGAAFDPEVEIQEVEKLLFVAPFRDMLEEQLEKHIDAYQKKIVRLEERLIKTKDNLEKSQYQSQIDENTRMLKAMGYSQFKFKQDAYRYLSRKKESALATQEELNIIQTDIHEYIEEHIDMNCVDDVQLRVFKPLLDILLNETRKRTFTVGQQIVQEGEHGGSAFFVLSGEVGVHYGLKQNTKANKKNKVTVIQKIRQAIKRSAYPETRSINELIENQDEEIVFHQDLPVVAGVDERPVMREGTLFGENSALTRTPRSASIVALNDAVLLEIKWQGLRDLMQYGEHFKLYTENLYRQRALESHLEALPMFKVLSNEARADIVKNALFETYGRFDWFRDFDLSEPKHAKERIEEEPLIVDESFEVSGLILIRSGFARLSENYNHGYRTLDYLSKGNTFGFNEVMYNIKHPDQPITFKHALRAVGYTEVIHIPFHVMARHFADIANEETNTLVAKLQIPKTRADTTSIAEADIDKVVKTDKETSLLEFFTEKRFINGTQTMLINLDRCTRCDDCVRGCADNHDGNARFIRDGETDNHFMVANACMQCQDPVCMIYCPTGAIHRKPSGEVVINDNTCIGCSTCADSCPYNNIQMVNIRDKKGRLIVDENHTPITKATKCDMCMDQPVAPACEYSCPHDALRRIDIHNIDDIRDWLDS